MWAVGFALFVLGIVFVIVAPINRSCSAQTEGVLCDIRTRYNSSGLLPPMYIYAYRVNGTDYQIKSTVLSSQTINAGDHCTIWYDPKKPEDAQPFRYGSDRVYRIILILGIVMIPLGIFLTLLGAVRQSM